MPHKKLTAEEAQVILHKGTEAPFSGEYDTHFVNGLYICRQCETPLYRSYDKFDAGCGWPSFDDEIAGTVKRETDADGQRTEILCASCDGHLGHVFAGEHQTKKDTRHCVNSLSMQFISIEKLFEKAKADHPRFGAALFAAGCFWGVEHRFINTVGVLATQVGYSGGELVSPSYADVCRGDTGHAETVLVIYDKTQIDYQALLNTFFNMHDPTQADRQGPDVGRQYRSAIFYLDSAQQQAATAAIDELKVKGIVAVTEIKAASDFWPAEAEHQHYHKQHG